MGVDAAAAAPAAPREGRGPPPRWGALLLLFALGVSLVANASAAAAAPAVEPPTAGAAAPAAAATAPLPFRRPPPEQRAFRSPAVDSYLDAVYPRFKVSCFGSKVDRIGMCWVRLFLTCVYI